MTDKPDLASWLLDQIAEDERVAGDLAADGYPKHGRRVLSVQGTLEIPWPDRWNPVRVLAECDAKRRIIASFEGLRYDEAHVLADRVLRLLALPYSDRPGYREEWKP